MKKFILSSILFFATVTTFSQSSENFDGVTLEANGYSLGTTNPRIINGWSLGTVNASGIYGPAATNFIDVTNKTFSGGGTNLANGGTDKAVDISGEYLVAKTFVMKTTNANHFRLVSFYIDAFYTTWVVKGFSNGTLVISQNFSVVSNTPTQINMTDAKWQYVNEFHIERQDGVADILFFLDDITVQPAVPLPLTLESFSATYESGDVSLNWQTASEQNTAYFDIEQSNDGLHFNTIGKVDAAGHSNIQLQYHFTHTQPGAGIHYYRLKMADKDGSYNYSKIILASAAIANWKLSANPAKDYVELESPGAVSEKARINIVNASGATMYQTTLTPGNIRQRINVSSLSAGIYYLQIQLKQQQVVLQFIKQ